MKTLNAAVALLLGLAAWPQAGRCAPDSDLASAFLAARANVAAEKIVNHQPDFKASEMSTPDPDWQAILAKLRDYGKFVTASDPIPASFQLADVRGSTAAAHIADYVVIWGGAANGAFQPLFVSFVSEDWEIDAADKNWHVDQWLYSVDLYGKVTQVIRVTLVETATGEVLAYSSKVPGDADAQAKYEALIKLWLEFQPQETKQ